MVAVVVGNTAFIFLSVFVPSLIFIPIMEISGSQYQNIQFLSQLTTQQIFGLISSDVDGFNYVTGSIIDVVLTDSGSALLSNDLWTFETVNPTGSLLNIRINQKNLSSDAIAAVVMLSEGLSTGSY